MNDKRRKKPRCGNFENDLLPRIIEVEILASSEEQYTDEQIAEQLGISYSTFQSWKRKHMELREALRCGRRGLVKNAHGKLYELACGATEITETTSTDKAIFDNKGEKIGVEHIEKVVNKKAPNLQALSLFLHNHDPEFKDAKDKESNTEGTVIRIINDRECDDSE